MKNAVTDPLKTLRRTRLFAPLETSERACLSGSLLLALSALGFWQDQKGTSYVIVGLVVMYLVMFVVIRLHIIFAR